MNNKAGKCEPGLSSDFSVQLKILSRVPSMLPSISLVSWPEPESPVMAGRFHDHLKSQPLKGQGTRRGRRLMAVLFLEKQPLFEAE